MKKSQKPGIGMIAFAAFIMLSACASLAVANTSPAPFKLLFSGQQDIQNSWGKLHISVTPTDWINRNAPESPMNSRTLSPIRYPVACFPQGNGSWVVFSQQWETVTPAWPSTNRWSLMRGTTTDGVTFSNVETVIPATQGTWTNHLTIAYNPDAGEYMMLKMDIDPRGTSPNDSNGFVYHSWFSSDGRQWVKHTGNRPRGGIFYEADAVSSFWSPVLKRFVVVSKSIQPWPAKRIIDHAGQNRRVLMIRSSPDGRNWTPDGDLKNIYGLNPASPDDPHPDGWYTVPDANDPVDLEFYSGTAFWYHDRAYMMVLNYAASPMFPNEHGEELDNEWWTSPDGLNWERPARGKNAHAAFMDGKKRIDMPPLVIGGKLQWTIGRNENSTDVVIAGLPVDRISGVSARANGEFSTKLFKMPNGDLRLNAAVPSLDRPWVRRSPQPYLMAEVLNAQGSVIPGFERDKFIIWDGTTSPTRDTQVDTTDMLLAWSGKSARQLAGQDIRLRFYFGGSTIYAVTSDASAAVNSYSVTYNANGATTGTAPASQTKTQDVALTLATNSGNLARTGYTFAGWNTAANGSGTNYAAGGSYTGNANLNLYAKWTSLPPGGPEATETFDSSASASSNGWVGSGNTSNGNSYGWSSTGLGSGGSAGGIFARTTSFAHFADTSIVTLSRTDTIRLAGSFRLANTNFDGAFYLGYFTPGQGINNFIGIQFNEPSEATTNPFRGTAKVNGTGGAGSSVISLPQDTTLSFDLTWTGNPDGSGTLSGILAGQSVNVPVAAGTGSFGAFGLLSGGLGNSTEKTAGCYFDSLTYNKGGSSTTPASYTVTYNANGATSGTAPATQTKTHDVALTLATNSGNLARTGFTFAGWNTAADGTGTNYAAGASYTGNANLALFARWTANTYTVTYNANGATSGTAPATQTKTHDVALTLTTNSGNLVLTGYTFAGWNTAADGSGTSYAEGATYTGNANLALFARWTADTYTVTYNANGATSGTAPENQIKTHDLALTLAANSGNLTRTGFTFAGWNTAADGTGTNYAEGASYTGNAGLGLFAKWTTAPSDQVEVTETFDTAATAAANGWVGSGNTANGNNFGWNSTDTVLGSGTGGAAGGIFARTGSFSHFADTSIVSLDRTSTLRLAGSFRLANSNYDGVFYLGYFTPGQGANNFVGIQIVEPSGAVGDPFRGYARVSGTGGAGSGMIELTQNTTLSFDLTWTGNPDGSGTLSGTLAGQSVNVPVGGGTGSFTAFGLLSGGISNTTERTADCYFDNLTYNKGGSSTTPATYTVTYNANGATSGTAPASQTKTHDVALTLATNTGNLARTGFTFAGWNTAADGTGTDYAGGGSYTGNDDLALFAKWTAVVVGPLATGGDLTEDITVGGINYRVHHFTSTTTQTFEVLADSLDVEYLIVGGGGGSGGLGSNNASGAGGAGGYLSNVGGSRLNLAAGSHGIAVGAGGAGGSTSGTRGSQGANSSAFGLTAIGGGGGGGNAGAQQTGGAGGSGGGGGPNTAAGGAGTAGQGNAGGTGFGGGGGAGSAGQAGGTGEGLQNSITGAALWYAGGGAGAFKSGVTPLGGGGSADTSSSGNQATNGQPNTGGGGGAIWNNGAKAGRSGGSGIVIVRYVVSSNGSTPFQQWSGAPGMGFEDDASGDGISNGMAFLLGAPGPEGDANHLLPAPARTNDGLTLSFKMRDAESRGSATMSVEYSSDLVNWTTVPVPDSSGESVDGVAFDVSGSGMHDVKVTIPSVKAVGGRLYARLKASE
jgi:uncharacterized repeat protein (TIGR02543 family)